MTRQFGRVKLPFCTTTALVQAGQVNGVVAQVVEQMGYRISGTQPKFARKAGVSATSTTSTSDARHRRHDADERHLRCLRFTNYREGVLRRLKATDAVDQLRPARVLVQLLIALVQAALVIAVGVLAFGVDIGGWSW